MQQTFKGLLVCLDQVFLLEMIPICRGLMVLPSVDELVCVLRVLGSYLSVHEILLRNVVVGGFVRCQLRFHEQAIPGAIPWHVPFLVFTRHQIILLCIAPIMRNGCRTRINP